MKTRWKLLGAVAFASTVWLGGVFSYVRISAAPVVSQEHRERVAVILRGAMVGHVQAGEEFGPAIPGPTVVVLFCRGREVVRVQGQGPTLSAQVASAASQLAASPLVSKWSRGQECALQVDVVSARGPFVRIPVLEGFSVHAGIDGFGAEANGMQALLLPSDLVARGLLTSHRPITSIPDFEMGFDYPRAMGILERKLDADNLTGFRFRTDSFVVSESPEIPILPLFRGRPKAPAANARTTLEAALGAGRYLVASLGQNGRYAYLANLSTGSRVSPLNTRGPYNVPRHASTTYFLAELFRHTGEPWIEEPLSRAIKHLAELVSTGSCKGKSVAGEDYACVMSPGTPVAKLGSAALAVVALVENRRATGTEQYDPLIRALSEWILSMQRADGSFAHLYNVETKTQLPDQKLYYSGEAALALARLANEFGDPRFVVATRRALDFLVGWYDFYLGGYFFGEEHWTCVAAEAAWPLLKEPRYVDFCVAYARFLARQQAQQSDFSSQQDLVGGHYFTPFVLPQSTPTASHTEATISALLLARYHGRDEPGLVEQVTGALGFLLHMQIRPDGVWNVALPDAVGAIQKSPVSREVRIDYLQHAGSALLRGSRLLSDEPSQRQALVH